MPFTATTDGAAEKPFCGQPEVIQIGPGRSAFRIKSMRGLDHLSGDTEVDVATARSSRRLQRLRELCRDN